MSNDRFEVIDLAVCTVCLCLIANGEYEADASEAEAAWAGMARTWGDNARHLVAVGDSESWFSWTSCDACESPLGGDRHAAAVLIPKEA